MKKTNDPKRATAGEWVWFIAWNAFYTYALYWFVERGGI